MDTTEKDIRNLFCSSGPLDRDEVAMLMLQLVERIQNLEQAPQRQPLTLETVYETIIHWDEGGGKRSRRELARRIVELAAHGIKGEV
jgi:hypothetical protein